jgi:hypothetical protein
MIVTSTPLAHAKHQLEFWRQRYATARQMPVKRAAGCFPSEAARDRELFVCIGAIQALMEVTDVEYANIVPATPASEDEAGSEDLAGKPYSK